MKLRSYIKRFSAEQRAAFAVEVGTTIWHLQNVVYEQRVASAALTRQIALRTNREVPEWEMRPRDWWLIWPELIGTEGAPHIVGDANDENVAEEPRPGGVQKHGADDARLSNTPISPEIGGMADANPKASSVGITDSG